MSGDEPGGRALVIEAADGFELAASLYEPARDPGRAAVLVTSAIGVQRTFYGEYAAYLADRGLPAVTLDYRGVGDSLRGPLSGVDAGLEDWAEKDVTAGIRWLAERYPDRPLLYVGHSMGIQLLGLTPENARVAAAFGVACPSAYWKLWSGLDRAKMFLLWHVVFPVSIQALGYFPARRLGLGSDLPPGVARDWARWARHPDYIVDGEGRPLREHFHAFEAPLRAYSFTDDDLAPAAAVAALLRFYANAPVEHRRVAPAELGVERVGHVGFFRPRLRETLWAESVDWLLAQLPKA